MTTEDDIRQCERCHQLKGTYRCWWPSRLPTWICLSCMAETDQDLLSLWARYERARSRGLVELRH